MPNAEELSKAGIKQFNPPGKGKGGKSDCQSTASIAELLAQLGKGAEISGKQLVGANDASQLSTSLGPGLPTISQRTLEKIWKGEYIDFNELPPAKGKGRSIIRTEGKIVLIQASELMYNKKLIPDFGVWTQCFAMYMAAVTQKRPDRVPELLAYLSTIAKASTKYKWP